MSAEAPRVFLLAGGDEQALEEAAVGAVACLHTLARSCRRHPLNKGLSRSELAAHSRSVTPSLKDVNHCLHDK